MANNSTMDNASPTTIIELNNEYQDTTTILIILLIIVILLLLCVYLLIDKLIKHTKYINDPSQRLRYGSTSYGPRRSSSSHYNVNLYSIIEGNEDSEEEEYLK